MSTITRQPGNIETPVDIEWPTAPEFKGDHGMKTGAIIWNPLPTHPAPAKHNEVEQMNEAGAPLWKGDHGMTKQP